MRLVLFNSDTSSKDISCNGSVRSSLPTEVLATRSPFCYQGDTKASVVAYYRIQVPNGSGGWKDSGFWVDAYAHVRYVFKNELGCSVKKDGGVTEVDWAPYACSATWAGNGQGGGINPGFTWSVSKKPETIIDAKQNPGGANQAVTGLCTVQTTDRCVWTLVKSSVFTLPRDEWTQLTSVANSCPPFTKESELTWSSAVSMSWSDNIGGKVATKGEIAPLGPFAKVEASLEASYSHTVTQANTWTETYKITVPLNKQMAIYLAPGVVQAQGDFTLYAPDKITLVKNVIVDFPLAKEWRSPSGGQSVPKGIFKTPSWDCHQPAPSQSPSSLDIAVKG